MSNQAVSKGVGEFRPSQASSEGSGGFLADFLKVAGSVVNTKIAAQLLNAVLRGRGRKVWINPDAVEVIRVDAEGKYVEVYLNGWRVYIDEDVVEVYGK